MSIDKKSQTPSLSSERFAFVTGTDIREANKGREKVYRPWEAPGLADLRNAARIAHQRDVDRMTMAVIDAGTSDGTPPHVKEMIETLFFAKGIVLDSANRAGYKNREMKDPRRELEGELLELHERVMDGTATQAEIDTHLIIIKRATGELALARTVENLRTDIEQPMFEETLGIMGNNPRLGEPEKLEIVGFDNRFSETVGLSAMRLRFKRPFFGDREDDISVKSRHRVIVRTDEGSGFNQDIRRAIEKAVRDKNVDTPLRLRRVDQIVTEIAETGATHPLASATMTSIYESNPERKPTPSELDF